jgi:hypothetical protein
VTTPPATAARDHLVRALEADLVGPFNLDQAETFEEVLRLPPSRWYLTGFLAPEEGRQVAGGEEREDETDPRLDPTVDEELAVGPDEDGEDADPGAEPEPKQKNRLPASMGLTVLLPPGTDDDVVKATVRFADYVPEEREEEGREKDGQEDRKKKRKSSRQLWRRVPRQPVTVEVRLRPDAVARGFELPGTDGIWLRGRLRTVDGAPDLRPVPPGTRALSLFVVNRRGPGERGRQDEKFIFQVCLEVEVGFGNGIVPRPNRRDEGSDDWDEQVADLQFRDRCEHAVGHGVSVEVPEQEEPVRRVRTSWIPRARVPRVEERRKPGIETGMEVLAELADGAAVRLALTPLVDAYGIWIEERRQIDPGTDSRRKTRDALMDRAERARERIAEGIALLEKDPEVLEAFRLANRAMAMAARKARQYEEGKRPGWRLFQLAFVLLNLFGIADEGHPDRETVELIFFPTGGGKTEAYLGVIAFTLVLRRLRRREQPDGGLGVAVLLRYTLRLLTLDQLARAATLVCALESLRRGDPGRLGDVRFTVGLWVGKGATANRLVEVADQVNRYKSHKAASPFPLTACPWCGTDLGPDSLTVQPKSEPREVIVGCLNHRECEFSAGWHPDGLPVLFVDEQIYRELPGFLVATVDKFAMLPWRGEAGMLFGKVHTREGRTFAGPVDGPFHPGKKAVHLPEGLKPPELIVQDELHLISGPLGTMVGLYETAIEALSTTRDGEGRLARPKILASTATVRRAREQIKALFGREETAVFPPAGVDDSETWFAQVDGKSPGRFYVGVAAPGRAMKAILLRVYVALLAAAHRAFDPAGKEDQPADAYMTLAGYFNSLRELGAMRRLVEDEVRVRCAKAEERVPLDWQGPHSWFRDRQIQIEPAELTSRETTAKIAATRSRLRKLHQDQEHVDVLLASNMISVGVDIDRLGLMIVAGQPRSAAEYIQASSRVGRAKDRPGLVVTCFNVHKPRDRSHYERFTAFHESFYRFVEASSLTPFSGPALDRGLAGALVALTRHGEPGMTPPRAAMILPDFRTAGEAAVQRIAERAGSQPGLDAVKRAALAASLTERGRALLDAWERLIVEARSGGYARSYSRFEADRAQKQLLRSALDNDGTPDEERFTAPTSMRDVEPVTHLWVERRQLGRRS